MPSSPAVRMISRAESAPRRWPSMRGRWRDFAQRPLPSMITATWRGRLAAASKLNCACELIFCGGAPWTPFRDAQRPPVTLNKNRLVAARADGGDEQIGIRQAGDGFQIFARFQRQPGKFPGLVRRHAPARELDVNRLASGENFRVIRNVIVLLFAMSVRDTDLD